MDDRGYLTLVGRVDDCFKTLSGHLVDPAAVASALDGYPGVTDVAVVPLDTPSGSVLGVLVEGTGELDPIEVRDHLARSLPLWSQPRVLETTAALPRLSSGRIDRSSCIHILAKSLPSRDRKA